MGSDGDGGGEKLGWIHGIALVVGSIVGSGLFVSPGDVFAMSGSVGYGLIVWLLAGLLCLVGGLCYAELGCAVQRSGGEYAIFYELLGRPFGFAFAWMSFWIQAPAGIAILGITFARYVGVVVFSGMDPEGDIDGDWRVKALSTGAIISIGIFNSFGLQGGAALNTSLTALKMVAVAGTILMGVSQLPTGHVNFEDAFVLNEKISTGGTPGMMGLSVIAALWSYDGWNALNYLTGSLKKPAETLPLCVFWGMLLVIAVTIMTNVAFLLILTPDTVATNKALAITAGEAMFGKPGGYLMSMVVAVNVYGVLQTCLMGLPFVYNEAAVDGLFPAYLTDSTRDIALPAIWLPLALAVAMTLKGSFTVLSQIYGVTMYLFYTLAMVCLIRLRRKGTHSDYRVPLYPVLPLLFIACSVALVVNALVTAPLQSIFGVGFCLLGFPVYYWVDRDRLAGGGEGLLQESGPSSDI